MGRQSRHGDHRGRSARSRAGLFPGGLEVSIVSRRIHAADSLGGPHPARHPPVRPRHRDEGALAVYASVWPIFFNTCTGSATSTRSPRRPPALSVSAGSASWPGWPAVRGAARRNRRADFGSDRADRDNQRRTAGRLGEWHRRIHAADQFRRRRHLARVRGHHRRRSDRRRRESVLVRPSNADVRLEERGDGVMALTTAEPTATERPASAPETAGPTPMVGSVRSAVGRAGVLVGRWQVATVAFPSPFFPQPAPSSSAPHCFGSPGRTACSLPACRATCCQALDGCC